jgi:hypothetical protein
MRKGAKWQRDTPYLEDRPSIPPCTGTDAPEARPSPLEAVRAGVERYGYLTNDKEPLSALATLEESIRAEEREACAQVTDLSLEVLLPDRRRISNRIRARGKAMKCHDCGAQWAFSCAGCANLFCLNHTKRANGLRWCVKCFPCAAGDTKQEGGDT